MERKKTISQCELCSYYEYNDESEQAECLVNLDQDELAGFLSHSACPCFHMKDDYRIVRKQN